jgi:hypothetical protein
VVESSDDDENQSFKEDSGDESGHSTESISNNEVQVHLFSYNLERLPDVVAACQCFAKEDYCQSQLW